MTGAFDDLRTIFIADAAFDAAGTCNSPAPFLKSKDSSNFIGSREKHLISSSGWNRGIEIEVAVSGDIVFSTAIGAHWESGECS